MPSLYCLISPLAKSAFFAETSHVAQQELTLLSGISDINTQTLGGMHFLVLPLPSGTKPEDDACINLSAKITRACTLQGIFFAEAPAPENALQPLLTSPDFLLNEDFIFGAKFKGKTNELLTQLMVNAGLHYLDEPANSNLKVIDPMCGRATTLLWAQRYGMQARGVEQDAQALSDIERIIKKNCKLHRQKHQFKKGFMHQSGKKKTGPFIEFTAEETSVKVIQGDTQQLEKLTNHEKFHLLITDLPYGIQHSATSSSQKNTKAFNPLEVVTASLAGWYNSLKAGGVAVVAFNRYQPKRDSLLAAFEQYNWQQQPLDVSHRMSESIVRDVIVFKKP